MVKKECLPIHIYIDGPQGAGKSGLSDYLSTALGFRLQRGIPTGLELSRLGVRDVWFSTRNISRTEVDTVFDRSFLSLIAYTKRTKSEFSNLIFSLGCLELTYLLQNCNPFFLLIDAIPKDCWQRQTLGEQKIASFEELEEEVLVYRELTYELQNKGLPVYQIPNREQCKEQFFEQGLVLLKSLICSKE